MYRRPMTRSTARAVIATLIRAGRRDYALVFAKDAANTQSMTNQLINEIMRIQGLRGSDPGYKDAAERLKQKLYEDRPWDLYQREARRGTPLKRIAQMVSVQMMGR